MFAPTFEIKAEGIAEAIRRAIEKKLTGIGAGIEINVVAKGSTSRGSKSRSASTNAMLSAVLARDGRNFRFLSKEQMGVVKTEVAKAIRRDGGATNDDWTRIGKQLIDFVRSNLEANRNPSGSPFRPLSPEYAKAKAAAGYGGQPIGIRTGQLAAEMGTRIRKL